MNSIFSSRIYRGVTLCVSALLVSACATTSISQFTSERGENKLVWKESKSSTRVWCPKKQGDSDSYMVGCIMYFPIAIFTAWEKQEPKITTEISGVLRLKITGPKSEPFDYFHGESDTGNVAYDSNSGVATLTLKRTYDGALPDRQILATLSPSWGWQERFDRGEKVQVPKGDRIILWGVRNGDKIELETEAVKGKRSDAQQLTEDPDRIIDPKNAHIFVDYEIKDDPERPSRLAKEANERESAERALNERLATERLAEAQKRSKDIDRKNNSKDCKGVYSGWRDVEFEYARNVLNGNRFSLEQLWRLCVLRDGCIGACSEAKCGEQTPPILNNIVGNCPEVKRQFETMMGIRK